MHADRTNRTAMLLLAVVLIALGTLGALLSFGVFGTAREHRTLLNNSVSRYFGSHGDWLWPVAAVVALLVVLAALRWLLALLFSTDRAGDLRFPTQSAGRTTLAPAALTDAVTQEISTYRGVTSAKARLIGDETDPELVVTAALADNADFGAVRTQIETGALAHARTALNKPALRAQLDLTVSTKRSARVS